MERFAVLDSDVPLLNVSGDSGEVLTTGFIIKQTWV